MGTEAQIADMLDQHKVLEVVTFSLACRDKGEWEALRTCFHPEAIVSISWFYGNAGDFVEGSRRMTERQPPGESSKHMMANPRVRVRASRAIAEYDLILHQRRRIGGHEFDLQTWSRYLDLVEKREGIWRLIRRTAIYEKDRMDPCVPYSVPPSFFQQMDLERFPQPIRFHCWRNAQSGHEFSPRIVLAGTERERAAREEGERWLSGGTGLEEVSKS